MSKNRNNERFHLRERFRAFKSHYDKLENDRNPNVVNEAQMEQTYTVKRNILYKDPDLNSYGFKRANNFPTIAHSSSSTQFQNEDGQKKKRIYNPKRKPKPNEFKVKLNTMLAKPAEMDKGKSLLEKMGWKGGGLGKAGEGIVEPIAPVADYATQTIGLGLTNYDKIQQTDDFNCLFRTNVLIKIQNFVKNNREIEMTFDNALTKAERKRIHQLCEALRAADSVNDLDYDNHRDLDIAEDILESNNFLLVTESSGKAMSRQLTLYKEAPENMYLVTPDDFKDHVMDDDDETKSTDEQNIKSDQVSQNMEVQNDNNQIIEENDTTNQNRHENKFENHVENLIDNQLTSIKEVENLNISKQNSECNRNKIDEPKNEILTKILNFFKEFVQEEVYDHFRFLGHFSDEEDYSIQMFFDLFQKESDSIDNDEFLEILNDTYYEFNLMEDSNGILFIQKVRRI